jgi:acyl-CoA reductase-like NAD-dependent aldehyde dehydrogenase
MTIDGQPVTSTEHFDVENPATGVPFACAPRCTPEQLDTAMRSAARAGACWAADSEQRRAALRECAAVLTAHAEQIAALLTLEQGKPIAESRREVAAAAAWFAYYAALDQPVQVVQDDAAARIEVHSRPLGVVAAITPWNFPILLASWKLAPALRAGNSVVLKPSPFTPLTSLLLGQLLAEVLPAGVLNVISGLDELGPLVTSHPTPRKISFTGSTRTGRSVAEAVAGTFTRLTLELGGNDAAIVLDDVEPGVVAQKLFWSAFVNNGQACVAIKRLFVPRSVYGEYVEALASIADNAVIGAGSDPATQLGPLNNRAQCDRVADLTEAAVRSGARVATKPGPVERSGYFHRPTILADVPDNARVVAEEQFGPVLPVLAYDRVEDAVTRANDTEFGLAGSVWGADAEYAQRVAGGLECGTVWVNTHAAPSPKSPFTGVKDSGLGVENGPWGLDSYTQLQTQYLARA